MITLSFDKKINGDLLVTEFAKNGLVTDVVIYPENVLELNGLDEKDRDLAQTILEKHVAPQNTEVNINDKLASVGLSIDDLKAALGL